MTKKYAYHKALEQFFILETVENPDMYFTWILLPEHPKGANSNYFMQIAGKYVDWQYDTEAYSMRTKVCKEKILDKVFFFG